MLLFSVFLFLVVFACGSMLVSDNSPSPKLSHSARLILQNAPVYADKISELQLECMRLQQELQQQQNQIKNQVKTDVFLDLQTLLVNYPSLIKIADLNPDLPVKNIISLFNPLDNIINKWGYEPIGKVWEQVEYNPQIHQSDNENLTEGELVYIRFVGYKQSDLHGDIWESKIIIPAKVSRTLPGV